MENSWPLVRKHGSHAASRVPRKVSRMPLRRKDPTLLTDAFLLKGSFRHECLGAAHPPPQLHQQNWLHLQGNVSQKIPSPIIPPAASSLLTQNDHWQFLLLPRPANLKALEEGEQRLIFHDFCLPAAASSSSSFYSSSPLKILERTLLPITEHQSVYPFSSSSSYSPLCPLIFLTKILTSGA